ncbi:catalase, partial [archaeon]
RSFVKFHVKTDAGIKNLTSTAAEAARSADSDFLRRDLTDFIMAGGEATYTMFVQVIPEADVEKLPYNILDVTKVVPHGDYPLQEVGRLVLNRMPENFFVETEQVCASHRARVALPLVCAGVARGHANTLTVRVLAGSILPWQLGAGHRTQPRPLVAGPPGDVQRYVLCAHARSLRVCTLQLSRHAALKAWRHCRRAALPRGHQFPAAAHQPRRVPYALAQPRWFHGIPLSWRRAQLPHGYVVTCACGATRCVDHTCVPGLRTRARGLRAGDAKTGGPQQTAPHAKESSWMVKGMVGRTTSEPADPDADYVQARTCYLTPTQVYHTYGDTRGKRPDTMPAPRTCGAWYACAHPLLQASCTVR